MHTKLTLRIASYALLALPLAHTACKPAKKAKRAAVVKAAPVAFSVDTTTTVYKLSPKPGHSLFINNLQVHVTSNTQPGVGVNIRRNDKASSNMILPFIANTNLYSYGGNVNLQVYNGEELIIDIADVQNGKAIAGHIIISGTEQKD